MKILVTGGSGFIGGSLVDYLKGQGHDVFNYDLKEGYDITDYMLLEKTFRENGFDRCYHLSAQAFLAPGEKDPYMDVQINVFGMINLLRCLEQFDVPMVYTSSGAVYGLGEIPHKEDSVCVPVSNYGVSKLAAEDYLRKWVITKGINAIIARFSSVYGKGRRHGPVNIFINQALKGGPLTVYGKGEQTRDLCHISDVLKGLELVLEKGVKGEIYNVGYGQEHSVNDVASLVKKFFQVEVTHVEHEFSPFDLARSWLDITKAEKLGYRPMLDLEQGIRLTIGLEV